MKGKGEIIIRTLKWNNPQSLRNLLCEIVSWQSRTGTEGEQQFSHRLKEKLSQIEYFRENPTHLKLHDAKAGRYAVTALYKSDQTDKTIVLMSHFDTVHTEEFGDLGELAFQPEELTEAFKKRIEQLPEEAQTDLNSGEYLFGRGTMDMKMGLVLHMFLIEKAIAEKWPINLVLLTVPDEEVNSAGMRAAVPELLNISREHQLNYQLFLNSEPSFSQHPKDENYYIYSGTIGKIMPSALYYGRETHAGEPLSGMTGQFIASYLTRKMEWNPAFKEEEFGEVTPLPVNLQQKDLKEKYSVQTSHRASSLYNVFMMKRNAAQVMDIFRTVANEAMDECNEDYEAMCRQEGINPIGKVTVMDFEELLQHAENKLGKIAAEQLVNNVTIDDTLDDREKSIRIVDQILLKCQELAPVTVLFYAPPYYPAVNSTNDLLTQEKIAFIQKLAKDTFNLDVNQVHYFNGISDLSYVNYDSNDVGWDVYQRNTPVWGEVYSIPFEEMQQLQAPVLNVGPFGKDAHKLTERLHIESAFVQTPLLIEKLVQSMFDN